MPGSVLAHLDVPVAVLEHHDRVVDHQADGEHHAEQREHVDREAHEVEEEERAHQRHRDGDERDERRAQRRRKTKITAITRSTASPMARYTDSIERSMKIVESNATCRFMPSGARAGCARSPA